MFTLPVPICSALHIIIRQGSEISYMTYDNELVAQYNTGLDIGLEAGLLFSLFSCPGPVLH